MMARPNWSRIELTNLWSVPAGVLSVKHRGRVVQASYWNSSRNRTRQRTQSWFWYIHILHLYKGNVLCQFNYHLVLVHWRFECKCVPCFILLCILFVFACLLWDLFPFWDDLGLSLELPRFPVLSVSYSHTLSQTCLFNCLFNWTAKNLGTVT